MIEPSNTIPQDTNAPKKNSFGREVWETIRFIAIAMIVVIPIRYFIVQPFIVSGASMDPTFVDKQYLIVDEISYRLSEPTRGDVIIFKYPVDPTKYFIKRIIGLPGETITIDETGHVTVKSGDGKDSIILKEPYVEFTKRDSVERTLGKDEYFVMGDNRAESFDSRMWGPVPRNLITGKAFLRLFPLNVVGVLPGQFRQ